MNGDFYLSLCFNMVSLHEEKLYSKFSYHHHHGSPFLFFCLGPVDFSSPLDLFLSLSLSNSGAEVGVVIDEQKFQ